MKRLRNWIHCLAVLAAIATFTIVPSLSHGQTSQPQSNSAASSTPSATPVTADAGLITACAEAVEELKAARRLLASQNKLIEKQAELLTLEREISAGLKDIGKLNADEKTQLRDALTAKDVLIKQLKSQRAKFWTKAKWLVGGAAVGVIVGTVLANE